MWNSIRNVRKGPDSNELLERGCFNQGKGPLKIIALGLANRQNRKKNDAQI